MKGYIDLARRFREVKSDARSEDIAFESYTRDFFSHGALGWNDVLKQRRIVILGEPGSGKTWELQRRAELLSEEGSFAFFIRLDQLVGQRFEAVLSPDDLQRFHEWFNGTRQASFFLDSVDETKFRNTSDFRTALDQFLNVIRPQNLNRVAIILSSRITEWQPTTDVHEFNMRFPEIPEARKSDQVRDKKEPRLLVVHLEPLDRIQVERFAVARNVTDIQAFLGAVDKAHAWEFARRPLDVGDLVLFWNERRRIGSLTELIEFDIRSKLRSRSERADLPLSDADAQIGAAWFAAASVLSRRFTFRVLEDSGLTDGLDTRDCVPEDWSEDKLRALCNRPLFDGASYGRFRFHHRRVAEYLAARWLADRVRGGCPVHALKDLLFDSVGSRRILRPSLAPIAAWLCNGSEPWNGLIRSWVLQAAPYIHLQYGDPSCLSLDYKRSILKALTELAKTRRRIWVQTSHQCLSRLADPVLGPEVSAMILDKGLAVDIRISMIELVRHGQIAGCVNALIAVMADSTECDQVQTYAATAIGALRDAESCARLREIALSGQTLPNRLCAEIIEALYPQFLTGAQVSVLLEKTGSVKKYGVDLPYHLKTHFAEVVMPENVAELLTHLLALLEKGPLDEREGKKLPVSSRFVWIGQLCPQLLIVLMRKSQLSQDETALAARAILLLGYVRQCEGHFHDSATEIGSLQEATIKHPALRRECFWRLANRCRTARDEEPGMALDIFGYFEVLRLAYEDHVWLIDDIRSRPIEKDRVLALRVCLDLCYEAGAKRALLNRIRTQIASDASLSRVYNTVLSARRFVWVRRLWWRHFTNSMGTRWWWLHRLRQIQSAGRSFKDQLTLMRHCNRLRSGEPVHWLLELTREADESNHSHWTPSSWQALEKKRGKMIAAAARRGCKVFWPNYVPKLRHERGTPNSTPIEVIVGLSGLQASIDDGELNLQELSETEAKHLARYAVNELNGFTRWFDELSAYHSNAVAEIMCESIRGEWAYEGDRQDVHDVLSRLVWNSGYCTPLVTSQILDLLQRGDPPNAQILRFALTVLCKQERPPAAELASLASQRVRSGQTKCVALWYAIWLQTDGISAITELNRSSRLEPDSTGFMAEICCWLQGERGDQYPLFKKPDFWRVQVLKNLVPLIYQHVSPESDIDHIGGGVYSPESRDYAQRFRGMLLDILARSEDPEATEALRQLVDEPALASVRDWVIHLWRERTEKEADLPAWSPKDLRTFAIDHEVDPKNAKELFVIACKRIRELKFDVEDSDLSLRDELHAKSKELHFRRWLARRLNERSRNRYSIPQEPEIDRQQRPDLRFLRPGIGPVSVEAKIADLGWTVEDLLERLENQLVGQYLRDQNSRYGIYVIGYLGSKKHWQHPVTKASLSFEDVINLLSERAEKLQAQNLHIGGLIVVGLNFREPTRFDRK